MRVDGEVVTQLGAKVDPSRDDIRVDGVRVHPDRPRRYILLNKPTGYLTTRSDPRRRPTVMELLPIVLRSLFPVGRLDMSASGLLLLTDDGDFAQRVAHPRYGVTKTYAVAVRGVPSDRSLRKARTGIRVDGEWLKVTSVRVLSRSPQPARRRGVAGGRAGALSPWRLPSEERGSGEQSNGVGPRIKRSPHRRRASDTSATTRLRVILNEGRYREIGRLFKALGHPVVRLHREKVGFLNDRGLASGAFRSLHPDEVSRLFESSQVGPSPARASENDRSRTKKRREAAQETSQPPRAERPTSPRLRRDLAEARRAEAGARRERAANSASRGGGGPRH